MKICKVCKTPKQYSEFKIEKRTKEGYVTTCNDCINRLKREFRKNNPDICKVRDRLRRNLPHVKKYHIEYHKNNVETLHDKARIRYQNNREPYLKRSEEQRKRNPEACKAYSKQWRNDNREYLNQKMVERLHTDPIFKIKHTLRTQLRKYLKDKKDSTSSFSKYLGCNVEFLKGYFESKFRDGMDWKNYGKVWHIDHILPCRSFDFLKEEDKHKCFHYSNLQPLLVKENLSKQDKMPDGTCARHNISKPSKNKTIDDFC